MASGKRQPSKQKRTNQNRQERAARQARATNAAAASSSSGSSSGSAPARGSLLGRLRGAATGISPAAPRERTSSGGSGSGAASARPAPAPRAPGAQPAGYRAALTALLAAIAAVVASFFLTQPVDEGGDVYTRPAIVAEWAATALHESVEAPTADADAIVESIGDDWMPHRSTERMFIAYLPLSLAAALPILASYLLFRSVQQRKGAKVVNRAMYATLLGAFISLPLLQFFLPTVIAGWVAGFQVRKAERTEMLAAQAAAEGEGAADGEVIEADVIEAEVVDDAVDEADDDRG